MKHLKYLSSNIFFFFFLTYQCNAEGINRLGLRADSIATNEKITLGGIEQHVMIRGKSADLPVLLMMHGGPGFVESYFFRTYNKELEQHFIVVYWDQRGAGLSYDSTIPPQSMTLAQIVSDAHDLTDTLKRRFHKKKIYALGHSWGSVVGIYLVQQYPADFYKFIGVGQVVDVEESEKLSFQFTLKAALKDKNQEAIAALKKIEPYFTGTLRENNERLLLQRKWLDYYGGAVYGERNADKFYKAITAEEYALYDPRMDDRAQAFSMKHLWPEVLKINLFKTATHLQVPVYFFIGRHDYNTVYTLAEKYYKVLHAPHKELIWFENAAHWIPFEEPEKFNKMVVEKLLHEN